MTVNHIKEPLAVNYVLFPKRVQMVKLKYSLSYTARNKIKMIFSKKYSDKIKRKQLRLIQNEDVKKTFDVKIKK